MDFDNSKLATHEGCQQYKLVDVYEIQIELASWLKTVRIEIFQSMTKSCFFRARVWLDEPYNLYPSAFNTDGDGKNLQRIHSADILNKEITVILPIAEDLIKGKAYTSKEQFVDELLTQVQDFLKNSLG